jgi:hypothetical protein
LLKAREKKNERVRVEIRGHALGAIERRLAEMKATAQRKREDGKMSGEEMDTGMGGESLSKKRKPNLKPAWEEGGLKKKALP